MTVDNVALVQQLVDAINGDDLAALAAVVGVEFVDHNPLPGQEQGLLGLKQAYTVLRTAFPDLTITLEETFAHDDKLVARGVWRGTHQGEFLSVPPTDAHFEVSAVDIFAIVDDKLTERWGVVDLFGIVQQLGILPPMGMAGGSTRLD